jgi:serine/threonine protein kinase
MKSMATENILIKGRYQIGQMVGGGGMGYVYLGTDILTGDSVAIKQLRVEMRGSMSAMVERFLREGEALRKLNHPNIVKVLATSDEGEQHYIVMEYIGGGSLADLLVQTAAASGRSRRVTGTRIVRCPQPSSSSAYPAS